MKVGIVVPVLNYYEGFTNLMLSIKTNLDYKVYVQPQYRAQVPLSAAWNNGIRQAFEDGCSYALVCNDDIMFAPYCIDQMVKVYKHYAKENVIMVTPNNILGEVGDPFAILNYEYYRDYPDDSPEYSIADHPNFSCFLITQKYIDEVGWFDENFAPAWYEDNDSHRRATLAGYREITTTAAPMVHLGGQTTFRMESPNSGASQAYYIEKWGGIPASHPLDAQKEHYPTPYNDPNLTIKDWRGQNA